MWDWVPPGSDIAYIQANFNPDGSSKVPGGMPHPSAPPPAAPQGTTLSSAPVIPSMARAGVPPMQAPAQAPAQGTTLGGLPSWYDEYRARTRQIESSGRPNAVSPTGATGLYQFTRGTWNDVAEEAGVPRWVRMKPDPRLNAEYQEKAMAVLTRRNAAALEAAGIPVTPANAYLAHQQGAGGATNLLKNPNALAGGQAFAVNGGKPGMTQGQFAEMWANKYNNTKVMPNDLGGQPQGIGMTLNSTKPNEITVSGSQTPEPPKGLQDIDWNKPGATKEALGILGSDKTKSAIDKLSKGLTGGGTSGSGGTSADREVGIGQPISNSASYMQQDAQKAQLAGEAKGMLAALLAKRNMQAGGQMRGLLGF